MIELIEQLESLIHSFLSTEGWYMYVFLFLLVFLVIHTCIAKGCDYVGIDDERIEKDLEVLIKYLEQRMENEEKRKM